MRVFEFLIDGDKTWIGAPTFISAVQTYCDVNSLRIEELDYEDDIIEVPKEKWDEMIIKDPDGEIEDYSFSEWMKENSQPGIIAMSNVD